MRYIKGDKFELTRDIVGDYKYRCSHWDEESLDDATLLASGSKHYYHLGEAEYKGEMWTYFDYTPEGSEHQFMMKTTDFNKMLNIKHEYEIY